MGTFWLLTVYFWINKKIYRFSKEFSDKVRLKSNKDNYLTTKYTNRVC